MSAVEGKPGVAPRVAGETVSMALLHACRSQEAVAEVMAEALQRLLPGASLALCVAGESARTLRVDVVVGDRGPWQRGEDVELASWPFDESWRLPVEFGTHRLGALVVDRPFEAGERAVLVALLAHYGVALVNLTLNAESRQATENYCASLQALEEGIVLFQEEDTEAVEARLLSLASAMMHATAAALYVLREIGDCESGLVLQTTLGMPESLLDGFRGIDGAPWPAPLMTQPAQLFERVDDGDLAGLDRATLPPILQNIVAMPLRYHGITAGVCVLFNSSIEAARKSEHLGRVQSLGQLGAALLHRLQLEAAAAQNRAIERELQIAETIQKRLIPARAPASDALEFAWCSIAAQHIGGDYLDIVAGEGGEIHGVVADVSGHGINSALLMTSFRSAYRGNVGRLLPASLAEALNREVVHEVGATGMFITAAALRLAPDGRRMTITSAGHNPVLVFRRRNSHVERIDSHGPPLGFLDGAEYDEQVIALDAGDIVLLYTDGVTEATNAELEMYGEERLVELLRRLADAAADDIVEAVRADLAAFTGADRYDDDVSMLVIRYR